MFVKFRSDYNTIAEVYGPHKTNAKPYDPFYVCWDVSSGVEISSVKHYGYGDDYEFLNNIQTYEVVVVGRKLHGVWTQTRTHEQVVDEIIKPLFKDKTAEELMQLIE